MANASQSRKLPDTTPALSLNAIPAVREAIKRQTENQTTSREKAFLGRSHMILSIRIRTMSVMDFSILSHLRSPFLTRTNPSLVDLSMFLWVLTAAHRWWRTSGRFLPGWCEAIHAWLFAKRCRRLAPEQAALACFDYVDEMFADIPASANTSSPGASVSCVAGWCGMMRSIMHCESEAEVLDMPLPKLFQYLRTAKQLNNPGALEGNRKVDGISNRIVRDLRDKIYTIEDLREGRVSPVLN